MDNRDDPAFGKTAKFASGALRYDLYRESTASFMFTDREFMDQSSRAVGGDADVALGRTHRFFGRVITTNHHDALGVKRTGYFYDFNFRKAGRQSQLLASLPMRSVRTSGQTRDSCGAQINGSTWRSYRTDGGRKTGS